MKPARRSTAPLILTLVALALAFAFSAWCVFLAVSIERMRVQIGGNMMFLLGLEEVRADLLELERVVIDRRDIPQPTASWRSGFARLQARFQPLNLDVEPPAQVRRHLDEIDRALENVDVAAQALLAAGPDHPDLSGLDDRFHRANIDALDRTAAAINTIRDRQKAISSTLGRRWRSLYILAIVSVGAVVVLALLFRHARRDAEKHKQAEENLRQSEQRLESVLAAVPDLIIVMDARGGYREIYTAEPGLLYRPAEELFGRSIHDVLPKEAAAPIQEIIDRTLAAGELQQYEYPLSIDDEAKWFSARVAPFGAPDDPCVLWVARDITAHKLADEGLRESETRFRQLAENIDEVVSMAPAGRRGVEYVSPAYETIFGRTCQSLYEDPRGWLDLIHPEDKQRVVEAFEADAHRGCFDEEFRIVRDDGSVRWVRDRTFPIRDAKGNLQRIAGLTQDITAGKRAEQELREREERFRSILDTANDAVIVADSHSIITMWNKASEEIFGFTADEAVGQPLTLVVPERFQNVYFRSMDQPEGGLGQLLGRTTEQIGRRKDGSEFPLELSLASWRMSGGTFLAGIIRDITERRETEEALRESEQRFRSVVDTATDGVMVADERGVITLWNKSLERILGYTADEAIGRPLTLIIPQRHHHKHVREMMQARAGRGTMLGRTTEQVGLRKDGREVPVELSLASWRTSEGLFFTGIVRDITERKQAEAALRDSEQRFRSVFNETAVGMLLVDADGRFLSVNQSFCDMVGYTEQELLGKSYRELTHPDDIAKATERIRDLLDGQRTSFSMEKRYIHKDGGVLWALTSVAAVRDGEGRPLYRVVETQDITERKRAEQALRESETLLRQLTENIREVFWMTSADGHEMIYVSPAYEEIWGRTCQSLYEQPTEWSEAIHPEDRDRVAASFYEGAAAGGFDQEYRIVRPDGSIRWIRDRGFPISNGAGAVQRIAGIAEDISELVRHRDHLESLVQDRTAELVAANARLRQENAERRRAEKIQSDRSRVLQRLAAGASLKDVLTLLVETIEDVFPEVVGSILLLDDDGKTLRHGAAPSLPDFYNEAIDGLAIGPGVGSCGTAAHTGRRVIVEDVMTHPHWAAFRQLSERAGVRACWSEPIKSSTGEVLGTFAMYYHEPRGPDEVQLAFVTSATDLAGIAIEHKRAEQELKDSHERLRVADRLASLGTLTAGLGHDMSNVLFPIRCRLGALDWKKVPPDLKEVLTSSRTTVNYLQQLCNGLRLLAVDPEDAEASGHATVLGAWWGQVQPLMANLITDSVSLQTKLPDDLPPVAAAPHRLTQAVMNLVVNASEAMPDGGRILVWARAEDGGRTVHLGVTDEGTGMTEDVRRRAFDPFFTTKTRSLSTGFGLSLVHGLVRMSRGTITIESNPGRGTTVTMHLPAAKGPAPTSRAAGRANEQAAVTLKDPRTAAWVANMLESAGYIVRLAEDGDPSDAHLWVTEPTDQNLQAARTYVNDDGRRRILALGSAGPEWLLLGATVVEDTGNRNAIHAAVFEVTLV